MQHPDFFLGYLPFWIVNYGLAVVIWSCIGRLALSLFVPQLQPGNYIWRAFRALTDWAVAAAAVLTPRFVSPFFLPLLAAFWLHALRIVLFLALYHAGMTPTVAPTRP